MTKQWHHAAGALGVVLFAIGSWMGLFVAPPDRFMGDVMRILYVHVPTAWSALLCFTACFVFALLWLWRGDYRWDALLAATAEVGCVLGALLLCQGSIWAKPTWGVWWDWDPRLTTSAVMVLLFAGVLALRGFVDDPARRATLAAVAAIVAYVDVPIVYMSVKWWRTLHQVQSSPQTVDAAMVLPLRINAFAVLFIAIWLVALRAAANRRAIAAELRETEA